MLFPPSPSLSSSIFLAMNADIGYKRAFWLLEGDLWSEDRERGGRPWVWRGGRERGALCDFSSIFFASKMPPSSFCADFKGEL